MAPGKKKAARKRATKKSTRSRRVSMKKNTKSQRGRLKKNQSDIEEWMHQFLHHLNAVGKESKSISKPKNQLKRSTYKTNGARNVAHRVPTPYPRKRRAATEVEDVTKEAPAYNLPPSMKNVDLEDLKLLVNRAREANSLADQRALDRTLLQRINVYIKSGVAEGKRQARSYVRKALSFAQDTGLVIPMNKDGTLFRMAPSLIAADNTNANETSIPDSRNPGCIIPDGTEIPAKSHASKKGNRKKSKKRSPAASGRKRKVGKRKRSATKRSTRRKSNAQGTEKTYSHDDQKKKDETGGDDNRTGNVGDGNSGQQ